MNNAFREIGLNYEDFKKSHGKHLVQRTDAEVLKDLYNLIYQNKWNGVKHLMQNDTRLYRELSRIGFPNAFSRIGLDYRDYRYAIWSSEDVLIELENVLDNDEWKGVLHFKQSHPSLYSAIIRQMSFNDAFSKINRNYDDYRKDK